VTAIATVDTPLGPVVVEATERGVCGIRLRERLPPGGVARDARGRWVGAPSPPLSERELEHLRAGVAAVRQYFRGKDPPLPALDLDGSDFDRTVWAGLLAIRWGETTTYGELARRLGMPGAARAVGAANGRNPVAILVPCHRVVAHGGRLGGYAAGLRVKWWLLAHEAGHGPALRDGG
jgi:methylated-DNA-[protein]-cysteine S-methyltransferase